MQKRWHDVVLILALSTSTLIAGCAILGRRPALSEAEINSLNAQYDGSILAVDRTDYAKDWIGEFKGDGDLFNGQIWERQIFTRVWFSYGEKTADGRQTISIIGQTNRSNGLDGQFQARDIELEDSKELKGVFGISPEDQYSFPDRLEYSFSLNGDKLEGHVKEFVAESLDGPFLPRKQWVFELQKNRVDPILFSFPAR